MDQKAPLCSLSTGGQSAYSPSPAHIGIQSVYESLHLWPSMWWSHPAPVTSEQSANYPPWTPADSFFLWQTVERNRTRLKKTDRSDFIAFCGQDFPLSSSPQSSSPSPRPFHLDLKCSWSHLIIFFVLALQEQRFMVWAAHSKIYFFIFCEGFKVL